MKHVERSAAQQRRDVEESTRYPAPTFMTPLRDMTIVEGEKVHFDAKVAPVGDPTMKVEWFCNGKAIAASKAYYTLCFLNAFWGFQVFRFLGFWVFGFFLDAKKYRKS